MPMSQVNAQSKIAAVEPDQTCADGPSEAGDSHAENGDVLAQALDRLERALSRIERAAVLKPTDRGLDDRTQLEELTRQHGAMRSKVGGALEQLDSLLAELAGTPAS